MPSSVLNSEKAIQINIQIMNTFVQMHRLAVEQKDLQEQINELKQYFLQYAKASVNTQYDDESVVIGSNKDYAAIHQLGGKAGKNKKVKIPARPYLQLSDEDFDEILDAVEKFLK